MRIIRRRDEKGTSAIELVLYMPLLMIAIILTVQFAFIYLGNQVVSAAAREASRTARVTGNASTGEAKGYERAQSLGGSMLEGVNVNVVQLGDTGMRAVVTGNAPQILPFFPPPQVRETIEGPIERFAEDNG